MKPVLTFFFDALKPESLQYMPFLNSLHHQRRMRTELGYSVACHPSMYSGVHTDKHLQWFVWKFSPSTTPFGWARMFKNLGIFDNLPARYFLHKYSRMFRKANTSWFGVPLLVNLPLKYWSYFDVVENRLWNEPGYLQNFPTIFDILRHHKMDFEIVGMDKNGGDEFAQISGHEFNEIKPWTYFFLGSVDSFSHHYGQDSPETIDRMRKLDKLVETQYKMYMRKERNFDVIVFSDHGHIWVNNRIDIYEEFQRRGENLNKYIHMIEANYARFWFRNDKEQSIIERVLSDMEGGFILTPDHKLKYHVQMPDNRFGDLIFYLDAPSIFSKTVWGFGRTQKSMHGYLPDNPGSDGIFLSNRSIVNTPHVELVDVLPTILHSLGLPQPGNLDGKIVWADS